MARVIIDNTQFTPFSFDETLKRMAIYGQEYRAQETELADLDYKASVWDGMINGARDHKAYTIQQAYIDALKAQVDSLASSGLTMNSRRQMLDLKARYNKDILPIEKAFNRREELMKEQRAALANNPTLRYQRYANEMSLDDFLKNPTLDYGKQYSGALLTKQVSQMASNLKTYLNKENIGKLQSIGLPYQYQQMIQEGYSPDQVMEAMGKASDTDSEAARFLRGIVDQAMESSGVLSWGDARTINELRAFANQGLYYAIGKSELKNYTDNYNMQASLDALKRKRDAEEERRDNRLNPLALRSKEDISQANKDIQDFMSKGYFEQGPNGHLQMTEKGKKEYYRIENLYETKQVGQGRESIVTTVKTGQTQSKFRKFMDSLGGSKYTGKNSKGQADVQPGNMGLLFQKYIDDNKEGSYDTYHTTEYDRQLDTSIQDDYMKQIRAHARTKGDDQVLEVVKFKNGKWNDEDTIPIEDLKDYTVTNIRYSSKGHTAIIQKKDGSGEVFRVRLPRGIAPAAEDNLDIALRAADDYGIILDKGKRPRMTSDGELMKDVNGNIQFTDQDLTPYDIALFRDYQDEALSDMGSYGSQIVVPSTTKKEEYDPFKI